MKGRKRIVRIIISSIVAIGLILITAPLILNKIIQKRIRQEFTKLSPALQVSFSSLHTSFFSSSVSFDSLQVNFVPYSNQPQNRHVLYFPHASLRGINFLRFLFNKNLAAGNFILEEPTFQLDQFLLDKKDSAQSKIIETIKLPFKKLAIQHVELKKAVFFLHSQQADALIMKGDLAIRQVQMNDYASGFHAAGFDCALSTIRYALPHTGDSIHIQKLVMDSRRETLRLDSLHMSAPGETFIPAIKITGFNVVNILNDHTLLLKKIKIDEGKISWDGSGESLTNTSLPFDLKKIHVGSFQMGKATISYKDKANKCRFMASADMQELDVSQSGGKSNIHIGSVRCDLSDIHYSGDNYHDVEIKTVEINSRKERIVVDDLKIIPQLGKFEFERKLGHQADRVEASIPKIVITGPEIARLLQQKLVAEKLTISESKGYIFRDRRLPRLQKNIPLPAAFLKTLPIDIRIKTVELASSTVTYEEYPAAGYGQTGILRIENITAVISPFINHPATGDPAEMIMKVNGSVMGSGTVTGYIHMPLLIGKPYHITGKFENLELTKLNSSSENLGKIRIKSGFLDFLYFDFTMTEERSTGKIIGAYHHLVIQQLKKHTQEKNVADFASFMLRRLIIPLDKDKSLPVEKRTGAVNYTRDPTRFVSHYFLQSLLMGVKKSFALGFLLPK